MKVYIKESKTSVGEHSDYLTVTLRLAPEAASGGAAQTGVLLDPNNLNEPRPPHQKLVLVNTECLL